MANKSNNQTPRQGSAAPRSPSLVKQIDGTVGGQQGPLGTPVPLPGVSPRLQQQLNDSANSAPGLVNRGDGK